MHLPNSVYKYNDLQTYLCKVLVRSHAAGFPVYYKRYSGPQLMILRVLVAFIKTSRMDTSCFRLPDIICPEPAHSYSESSETQVYDQISRKVKTDSETFSTTTGFTLSVNVGMRIPWYPFLKEWADTFPYFPMFHGARHKCIVHVQLFLLLENTADRSMCSNSFKGCSGIGPGHLNTKWAYCVHTTAVKRHKAAIQNIPMNSVRLVLSCILPAWYISCWMTFKVDSFILFIN